MPFTFLQVFKLTFSTALTGMDLADYLERG